MPDREDEREPDRGPATLYGARLRTVRQRADMGDRAAQVRLAWRPAWSIRSRRGAWAAFRALWSRGRPDG